MAICPLDVTGIEAAKVLFCGIIDSDNISVSKLRFSCPQSKLPTNLVLELCCPAVLNVSSKFTASPATIFGVEIETSRPSVDSRLFSITQFILDFTDNRIGSFTRVVMAKSGKSTIKSLSQESDLNFISTWVCISTSAYQSTKIPS